MENGKMGQLNTLRVARLMLISFVATEAQVKHLLPPSETGAYSCEALFCRTEGEARRLLSICTTSSVGGVWYCVACPDTLVLARLVASHVEEEKRGYIFQNLVTQQYYLAAGLEEANFATLYNSIKPPASDISVK